MGSEGQRPQGGGLGERALDPAKDDRLGGTGGSAGGGTLAGEGEPSGADTDRPEKRIAEDADERGALFEAADELAGRTGSEEAAEAAALGPAEDSQQSRPGGGTIADALKTGEGPDVGAGTPPDKGELGGGEPAAESGNTGPAGTRSPGGEGRR